MDRKYILSTLVFLSFSVFAANHSWAKTDVETITIESLDGLAITADRYVAHSDSKTPWIVLCHQAGWSRGEYHEIAPKLGALGFNCLALDQRSGKAVNGVENQTAKEAQKKGRGTSYADAEQDIIAALQHVHQTQPESEVILWGSSYSSSLALRIAGEHHELVDGVLAFAPGEYFRSAGKPSNWIQTSAAKIQCPVFVTSAKREVSGWKPIFDAIPSSRKSKFVPKTAGNHGSRALWNQLNDSDQYWSAVNVFLKTL